MKIRTSSGPAECPKCSKAASALFKVQGQTEPMCPNCLAGYAAQQGVDKNVTIDGLTQEG